MLLLRLLPVCCLLVAAAIAQGVTSGSALILSGTNSASTPSIGGGSILTGTEVSSTSSSSTSLLSPTTATSGNSDGAVTLLLSTMATANASQTSSSIRTTSSPSVTILTGAVQPTSTLLNGTAVASATTGGNATITKTTSAQPSNTQPCNNYPELCTRKYSNITEVGAHNSPFNRPGNAASNQELGVITQLDDGIRMLSGQTHMVNDTLYYCHTSCDLLNAGTMESYLRDVTSWIERHPYDVVTILIGNGDLVDIGNYISPIENSGLSRYAYTPLPIPLTVNDWPTLSELILTGKRAVIFMDYKANQTAVPYILDEFSQMWETPFSPTDRNFPCTVDRPPDITDQRAGEMLYIANHNLNLEINFAGQSILVPNTVLLNETNNVTGFGSLGLMANNCAAIWPRPPNFLLVDYYNVGNGSVFEVAAQHNNVTYTRPCCGLVPSAAAARWTRPGQVFLVSLAFLVSGVLVLW